MTTAPPERAPWYHGRGLPPLGLAYIAAALEKAGFQVEILDNYLLNKPIEEVQQIVRKYNPEILGMTCGSATYRRCVETAEAVKQVLPSCTVIVGGWHPSYVPESMLEHSAIDYVIMGEGERAMVELASCITNNGTQKDLGNIAGVAYRSKGKIVKNNPEFISDLDQVPFPARHLLPMHLYERKMEYLDAFPIDTMHVIRGCPFNCAFCEIKHLWGHKCRSFSPKMTRRLSIHIVAILTLFLFNAFLLGSNSPVALSENFTLFLINFSAGFWIAKTGKLKKIQNRWTLPIAGIFFFLLFLTPEWISLELYLLRHSILALLATFGLVSLLSGIKSKSWVKLIACSTLMIYLSEPIVRYVVGKIFEIDFYSAPVNQVVFPMIVRILTTVLVGIAIQIVFTKISKLRVRAK